ncbi:hypothetical protein ACQ4LE_006589 [Meloidogyne hapla]
MSEKAAKKFIEEQVITVEMQEKELGLTFFDESSPPRIKKIDIFSCLVGILLVGDEILQIDKKTIKSSQDINEATHFPWTGPRNFRIRFRRDSFYRILVFKVSRIRRKPNRLAIILHARWRQDISVGLIVASEGESVQIVQVVQSSLASHHFRPGDVITDVNGERVTDTEEAVKLIRQSIAETNNFKLKIVRDISPLKRIADPAEDARSILLRNAGFWRKQCLLSSIEEEEGEVKPQKVSVYFVPKVESVPFPVDETGNELIATPSRPGGTLRERSSEDEDEEELIFPEEEDDF